MNKNTLEKIRVLIGEHVEQELLKKNTSILSEGIVHIENMKPEQLLNFLKTWNLDKAKFHVSEKMDGSPMIIGVKDGAFYMRSKNLVFFSEKDISEVSFMSNFKKYFSLLQQIPWNDIVSKLAQKYKFPYDGNIEIEGEAIPSYDYNIVMYDEAKIGDGVFIIFNTKTSFGKEKAGRITMPEMWKELAEEANKHSTIKFFQVQEVNLSDLEFDNSLIVSLKDLIEKNGNILAKPARKPEDKELKEKLLQKIKELGLQAKGQALSVPVKSNFGSDVEGVVIADPEGNLVKIVDTEKFTKAGERNWFFIKKCFTAERDFKKAISTEPDNLEALVKEYENNINGIEEEYNNLGSEYITIDKKRRDTEAQIKYARNLASSIEKRISQGEPNQSIVAAVMANKAVTEAFRGSLGLLTEGGNVFEKTNSVVPKALLEPNVENAISLAGLAGLNFEIVGNKNKEFFGDIDIAVDEQILNKFLGLEPGVDFWDALTSHLSASKVMGFSINKGLRQFHVAVPLVDSSGNQISAFDENGNVKKDEPGVIQIDVFVGSIEWMKDIDSGAPISSKFKAAYRNLLLASIASKVRWTNKGDSPDEYNRYVMNFREGLKRQKIKVVPPTGKKKNPTLEKVADEIITTNANDLAKILFGKSAKWSDLNSFEELATLLTGEKFAFKKFLPEILTDFKETLVKRGLEVPPVLVKA